jgi:hypothetical protein
MLGNRESVVARIWNSNILRFTPRATIWWVARTIDGEE